MMKVTIYTKRVEAWNVRNDKRDPKITTDKITVTKIAVRDRYGRFHGSTNFRQR